VKGIVALLARMAMEQMVVAAQLQQFGHR